MSEFEDRLNSILSSPQDMEKIMSLARSLGSGADASPPPRDASPESGIDPAMMAKIARIMSQMGSANGKTALVEALRPYIRDSSRRKLEQAAKTAAMAKAARALMSEKSGK